MHIPYIPDNTPILCRQDLKAQGGVGVYTRTYRKSSKIAHPMLLYKQHTVSVCGSISPNMDLSSSSSFGTFPFKCTGMDNSNAKVTLIALKAGRIPSSFHDGKARIIS